MAIVEQATSQANGNGLLPNSTTPDPQAAVEIEDLVVGISGDALVATMTLVNNTGHKFPSGAGFRRAFVKFEVLDGGGNVIWVSGQTNPYGAICDGACVENADGTYNLVQSEVTGGDPAKLQPHYEVVTKQSQVQVYEVQAMNDLGTLTSSTLALFHDAKDNRLLPRGFMGPEELGCAENPDAGTEIFGIAQCSAAYATEPQLKPRTVGSTIAVDPHYTQSAKAGSDVLTYSIPLNDMAAGATSVRVSLEYQTIPPGFLAQRFTDGHDGDDFLTATKRAVYLTSHLNLDLDLKSEHPDNTDVTFSKNWTTTIYQVTASLDGMLPTPVSQTVEIAPAVAEQSDGRTGCEAIPTPFYTGGLVPFDYSGEGPVLVSSTPDGTGYTRVDDALRFVILNADGSMRYEDQIAYATFCGSGVHGVEPLDISDIFEGVPGRYLVGAQMIDIWPDKESGEAVYLVTPE
jgi:hypothetical protein